MFGRRFLTMALLSGWVGGGITLGAAEIFPVNTSWRYFKGTSEASTPLTSWRLAGFNDASWLSGVAPFYYENSSGYSGNTVLSDMFGGYSSVYLRKTFNLTNPGDVLSLSLSVQCDDGAIVWINGTEVGRINMTAGDKAYNATAIGSAGEPNNQTVTVEDPSPLLVAGDNVVAIHAFNASLGGSSDFLISASLNAALDDQAPVVVAISPPPGAIVRQLGDVEVTFDGNVTGVDQGDLWINGQAATNLVAYSPRNYLFEFPQPPLGVVLVEWNPLHAITDLASTPNLFGGGSWTYTLDPTAPAASVIISEFLADNESVNVDDDGDESDWIELLNLGPEDVNLEGWFLTDDPENLTKWRFPSWNLSEGQYLVVWASEKDRASGLAPLHTNFRLSRTGEYLALVNDQTNVVSEFAPVFPEQRTDVSYGRDRANPLLTGFFEVPSPGGPNVVGGTGFAPDPDFSLEGGVYSQASISVTLSASSGVIRYTTNGSTPSESSPVYSGPISVSSSLVLKARVFQAGLLPSRIVSHVYNLVGTGLDGFNSDLPLLIINTAGSGIPQDSRIPATVTVIDTFRGKSDLSVPPDFQGLCQVEGRGQTSAGFAKRPYNVEINDAFGEDQEVSFLGLPPESDWVLNNPYSDKSFLNNFLAYELHEKMGHYAVRRRLVEVFVDTSGGRLNYPQDYAGIYLLLEKIKIDNNRVDFEALQPTDNAEPELTGGYIVKKDKSSPGDLTFSTSGGGGFSGQGLRYHEPKPKEISSAQQNWIRNYLNKFEQSLYAASWLSALGTNHYTHYMDVDSFVDYHWIVEFSKQIDGYRLSNYMSKDRGGKLKMEPIWDWNLSFGNADYLEGEFTSGWYWSLIDENAHIWLRRLITGTTSSSGTSGDPDFNQKIVDRWTVLRTNVLERSRVLNRVQELANLLSAAAERDFQKYPRLGSYVWPNPSIYSTPTTYGGIISNKKNWIGGRFDWIDSQYLRAPSLNRPPGKVTPGTVLSLTAQSGTIYYTLDGTDPRAPGGAVAPGALTYTSSFAINSTVRVMARARSGSTWSGLTAGTFHIGVPLLIVSEIMYHPEPDPLGSPYDAGDFEFIELLNTGISTIALNGVRFEEGIEFAFPVSGNHSIAPGERIVLVKNQAAFLSRYGVRPGLAGTYAGSLADDGERVVLVGRLQEPLLDFQYDDDWYPITDGFGFSLVPVNETAINTDWSSPASWRPAGILRGSAGTADPGPVPLPGVVIHEALTHTDPPQTDSVELYNPTASTVMIGGWFLTDEKREPKKFRVPDGTSILPGGYLVFDEEDFNAADGVNIPFQLSSTGDEIFLYSADANGNLTGFMHGFDFGAAFNGVTFGRHVTSVGEDHFVAQVEPTLGQANAGPRVGPVVIHEIMYRPPDVLANGAYWDNPEMEYIELHNLSAASVLLFDSDAATNTWRLRDAVQFTMPMNVTLPPLGFLLVVGFDPQRDPAQLSVFRNFYGVPPGVPVLGPYEGKLDNSSDSVELIRPDRPNGPGEPVPYVLADKVKYEDQAPWPSEADGLGASLQRRPSGAYGNDPASWVATGYSPGSSNEPNIPPTVQWVSPVHGSVIQWPDLPRFQAEAQDEDGAIIRVEFYAGQQLLGQDEEAPYEFTWAEASTGQYSVYAIARDSRGGFATSAVVQISIFAPEPEPVEFISMGATWNYLDQGMDPGSGWRDAGYNDASWDSGPAELGYGDGDEATVVSFGPDSGAKYPTTYFRHAFTVNEAAGMTELTLRIKRDDGAIAYLNGTEIYRDNMPPGLVDYNDYASSTTQDEGTLFQLGINPALIVPGVNVLAVEVHQANATSSDLSFEAGLAGEQIAFRAPEIIGQPTSKSVSEGDDVLFSVIVDSSLPLTYQWRKDGVDLPDTDASTLALDNVSTADSGGYSVLVSNSLGAVESNEAELLVLVPPRVVQQLLDQTVPLGGMATFQIVTEGTLPMGYRWRLNNATLTNMVIHSHVSTFVIPEVTMADAGSYSVIITNAAFYIGGTRSAPALLTVVGDMDQDGMADDWETAHDLDPMDPDDAHWDDDEDGLTNREEFIAGTDPQDPESYLSVDTIQMEPSVHIHFLAVSNRTYSVLYSDQLGGGVWQVLSHVASRPTNFTSSVSDPAPGSRRYYRLVTPQQSD